jgi:hypothetical protein
MAKIVHQYRLTDSVEYDSLQLAGVPLTKNWKSFEYIKENLQPFLKSTTNSSGMVDYQKVNLESNEVLYKTIPTELDIEIFDRNILFMMTRIELCQICKEYGIVTTNRTNQFLVKEILEKQEKVQALKEEKKEKEIIQEETTNKIETYAEEVDEIKEETKTKSIFDILKKN